MRIKSSNAWYNKKPSVVYGYEDTIMAFNISKILNVVMFIAVIVLLLFLSNQQRDINLLQAKLNDTLENIKTEKIENFSKFKTIRALESRIEELQAINNTSGDIENYIKTYHKNVPTIVAKEIARVTVEKATEHNVPVVAVLAVEEVESHFNPYAVSDKGARGVMQVMHKVWGKKLNLDSKYQLHDIETGIDSGVRILREYLDETNNNMKKALYKYVGGSDAYGKKVYEAMGKFIIFRSFSQMTVDENGNSNGNEEAKTVTDPLTGDVIPIAPKTKVFAKDDLKPVHPEPWEKPKPVKSTPFVHTIKHKGETLGLISQWYTGSVSNWPKIIEANPELVPEKLSIGQKIFIPDNILKNKTELSKEFIDEQQAKG